MARPALGRKTRSFEQPDGHKDARDGQQHQQQVEGIAEQTAKIGQAEKGSLFYAPFEQADIAGEEYREDAEYGDQQQGWSDKQVTGQVVVQAVSFP